MGRNTAKIDRNLQRLQAALGQQDWNTALSACETLIAEMPDNPSLHYNKGLILRKMQRNGLAILPLKTALRLEPNHTNALFEWASALFDQGDFDEASTLFTQYLEQVPGDRDALLNRANAQIKSGRAMDAIADLEMLLANDKSPPVVLALATAWRDAGRLDDCESLLATLDMRQPEFAIARLDILTKGNKGRINLVTGEI